MTGRAPAGTAAPDVDVVVADLVLVPRPGQALAELAPALALQLAAHGVPEAAATAAAAAILDHVGHQVER